MTGGVNFYTPERSFDPVYANTPLRTRSIDEIREHFNLKCTGKLYNILQCVFDSDDISDFIIVTDPHIRVE